jgi:hypothetical protein
MQDSGATDLSDLLGSGPVQNPSLPQSTTFAPIVTGGDSPFIMPTNTTMGKTASSGPSQEHTFQKARYIVKGLMTYVAFFFAAMIISLSVPRSLILQYIPNTYTVGGVPSYMGAAILAGVATALAYIVGTLINSVL